MRGEKEKGAGPVRVIVFWIGVGLMAYGLINSLLYLFK